MTPVKGSFDCNPQVKNHFCRYRQMHIKCTSIENRDEAAWLSAAYAQGQRIKRNLAMTLLFIWLLYSQP